MAVAKPLTDTRLAALFAVRDGKVTATKSYTVSVVRADTFGWLEERGLVEVDWDSPVGLRSRSPAFHTRYETRITDAGLAALAEAVAQRDGRALGRELRS